MEDSHSNYKIEESRTGKQVPVINGVYLHSIYDPEKEAQTLIEKSYESLKTKNYALVFGLGFGYHLNELVKVLKQHHQYFEVVVIEPNTKLIEDLLTHRPIDDERIQILNIENPAEAYQQEAFVEFLMNKPCVIKHEASFSINKDFYASFLRYKAETNIAQYSHLLIPEAKEFIDVCAPGTLADEVTRIQAGRIKNKQDYFTLALNEIISR